MIPGVPWLENREVSAAFLRHLIVDLLTKYATLWDDPMGVAELIGHIRRLL